MHLTVFSAKSYDRMMLDDLCRTHGHTVAFIESRLDTTTVRLAEGSAAVCLFVNDHADEAILGQLAAGGVRGIALRCAGYNQIDLPAAQRLGIRVARVPAYAPHAIAEHAVGLMLMLNRHLHRAYNRIREGNFALSGLMGFNLAGKTVAIIGTGAIGAVTARIMQGFGCVVLAHDLRPNPALEATGITYVPLATALATADIITLHLPLNASTTHLINRASITTIKPGAMLINTSRGGLIDTEAAIEALKNGRLGALGLDVYEHESPLFFEDHSDSPITDDLFSRLLTFPNVVITGHQAFFTREALAEIGETTVANLDAFAKNLPCSNEVTA